MAAVLQFALRDKGVGAAAPPLGPAEIVIFPGVRFERLGDVEMHNHPEDGAPNGSGPVQHRAAR
jgi:hypothetical protein